MDCDRVDDLQLAVQPRAQVRLARPHQPRSDRANIATSADDAAARNFGLEARPTEPVDAQNTTNCCAAVELKTTKDICGSLGLLNMRERARLIGGEYRIRSAEGEGTTVEVRVPLA